MVLKFKRKFSDSSSIKMNGDIGTTRGKKLESHDPKFESSARRFRSCIENDSVSRANAVEKSVSIVATEIECVYCHPVFCAKFAGQKPPRRYRMKAHAIGLLGKCATSTYWRKPRFKVLHKIETLSATSVSKHGIGSRPTGCHHSV